MEHRAIVYLNGEAGGSHSEMEAGGLTDTRACLYGRRDTELQCMRRPRYENAAAYKGDGKRMAFHGKLLLRLFPV